MKSLFFLVIVILGASTFWAYQEGYLAELHPRLDPGSGSGEVAGNEEDAGSGGDAPPDGTEAAVVKSPPAKSASPKTKAKAKSPEMIARELARAEWAEKDRLAREARLAERAAFEEAQKAEHAALLERRATLDKEVAELRSQLEELGARARENQKRMVDQEAVWSREKIKTREVDRQKLRDASNAYANQLNAQIKGIEEQIFAKRSQY